MTLTATTTTPSGTPAGGYAMPTTRREMRLARHVDAAAGPEHFELVSEPVAKIGPGQVLVRTDHLPLAAAYQDMMTTHCQLPVPPFEVGAPLLGAGALGTVIASESETLAVGDLVQSMTGWCDYSSGPAEQYWRLDRDVVPSPVYYLSQGPTAYYGMATLAQAGPGDVVFVSGAAGGVGSLAGQIARCRGAATVIGSAGSDEKVDYLVRELGFSSAFNYKLGNVEAQLREHAPDGINVYFDNVGGAQFEAAIQVAAPHARFVLCGELSAQNPTGEPSHPRLDLMTAITKHLELKPFATYHTPDQIQAWIAHFGQWLGEGSFVFPHTSVTGSLEDAPQTLVNLLAGDYRGNVSLALRTD